MIISKLAKARAAYKDAIVQIQDVLTTKRGSKEARIELDQLRQSSLESGECPYCKRPIVDRSPRHSEACTKCGRTIDNMLQLKSRILAYTDDASMAKQLRQCYDTLVFVPCALRGANGDVEEVKSALDFLCVAAAHYRLERKASTAREAEINLAERRREEIRCSLLHCGMTADDPALERRVEEIFSEQYS